MLTQSHRILNQHHMEIESSWDPNDRNKRACCCHLVSKLLDVAGVCVRLHDLELLKQSFFVQVLLEEQR